MARYRWHRTDFHTHPRTRGLSPLARDLMWQGIESNIAGLLERSPRKMAELAGGGVTPKDVDRAISELVSGGHVRYWDTLETLWVIEAADEQATNDKAWTGVENVFIDAPLECVAAFCDRYGDRVSDTVSHRLSHRVSDTLLPSANSSASVNSSATAAKRAPSADACAIAQYLYDAIREHSPQYLATAKPAAVARKLQGWARDIDVGIRNDGMTLDGCRAAIDTAHRSSDEFWRPNLLSGKKLRQHYERLSLRNGKRKNHHEYDFDFHALRDRMDAICKTQK